MAFTGITLFAFFNLKEIEGLKTHFKKFYLATSRGAAFRSEELGNPGILSELAQAKRPLFLHMEAHQGSELSSSLRCCSPAHDPHSISAASQVHGLVSEVWAGFQLPPFPWSGLDPALLKPYAITQRSCRSRAESYMDVSNSPVKCHVPRSHRVNSCLPHPAWPQGNTYK